jgi:signal transduction histidine kinase
LSNAVKFTPSGGNIDIRVTQNDSHVEVVVRDTGIGFSASFHPYMFERFRQAESGTTRLHGGLGLGLAIARHIVEMHGGTIDAASGGEGKGATFTVSLPLSRVATAKM